MNTTSEAPPGTSEIYARETHELVMRAFRIRILVIPLIVALLLVSALWDPARWKIAWLFGMALIAAALFLSEQVRVGSAAAGPGTVQFNLLAAIVLQSGIIFVTGGIESPLLVIFLPLTAVAGLSLASTWRAATVAAAAVVATTVFAAGALQGWLPRATPPYLALGEGFARNAPYVISKAVVLSVILVGATVVGVAMRRMFDRVASATLRARDSELRSLESRNREILSTAVTIAHELKNPMSSIQGLTQLMLRGAQPGTKQHERLEVMLREITRMSTVLGEFRSFTRPLSALSVERVQLSDIVEPLAVLHEGMAARRGVRLRASVEPGITLDCDPLKIKQALSNLILNAVEASPAGHEVAMQVARLDRDRIRIDVVDQGAGIAPTVRDRLFTPGFTTKQHGTGVGLVVARSVIAQHEGTLALSSGEHGGCTATIVLPTTVVVQGESLE